MAVGVGAMVASQAGWRAGIASGLAAALIVVGGGAAFSFWEGRHCGRDLTGLFALPDAEIETGRMMFVDAGAAEPVPSARQSIKRAHLQPDQWKRTTDPNCPNLILLPGIELTEAPKVPGWPTAVCLDQEQFRRLQTVTIRYARDRGHDRNRLRVWASLEVADRPAPGERMAVIARSSEWTGYLLEYLLPRACTTPGVRVVRSSSPTLGAAANIFNAQRVVPLALATHYALRAP